VVGFIQGVWARLGFGILFFLAAMSGIDDSQYEAARIDGAGFSKTFHSITLPSIKPAIEFWVVFSFIEVFARMFSFIHVFSRGGPGFSTYTLEYGIFVQGFENGQMGYSSAWACVLFFFCAVISIVQIRMMRSVDR